MICDHCKQDFGQVVYCDCFAVLCRECFTERHDCAHANSARFTRAADPPEREIQIYKPSELSDALYRLRPYQEKAIASIIEALT